MKYGREIWGWAFYDFANSAFPTTIVAVVFQAYFVGYVIGTDGFPFLGWTVRGASAWSLLNSLAMIIVALSAPLLGAIADAGGYRKRFLMAFCVGGACATALLALSCPPIWVAALFVIGEYCFSAANVFYNSFLPYLASAGEMGRVSGLGWGLGYLGGGLCLALNLVMIRSPGWFGLGETDQWPIRATFIVAGAWWLLFSLPTLLWLRRDVRTPHKMKLTSSYGELLRSLKLILRYPELCKYLIAFFLYNDAVETMIVVAAAFALDELKMSADQIVLCFLMIQAVALVGSFLFGWVADRIGTKRAIGLSLFVWGGVFVWAFVIGSQTEFWILGVIVGLVLGGTQASSRALMGQLTPPAHTSAFFGFYGLSGKVAAIMGTALFGVVGILTGSTRLGVLSLLVLIVAGLLILVRVDDVRGMAQANQAPAPEA